MNDKKQERWIYAVALLIPVVWLALLTAPCLGGSIVDVMKRLTEAIKSPLHIVWCENSLKCILVFLGLYAFGILLYLGSRGNTRDGEEHGSAKWGTPQELNKQLKQKENFPLSKEIRLGMDTHKHRRNLNVFVLGGSGAGKTRFVALPNILQANCSYVITDPKGEILANTGYYLLEQGYDVRVFNLVDFNSSDGYNPFKYLRDDKDVLKLITNLIRNTTPKGSSNTDPFWEKAETALLEALMFYLLYEAPPEEQNFAMIMKMLSYADVREEDSAHISPLDLLFQQLSYQSPGHIAAKQYAVYKQAAGKTAKSINISLAVRLAAFNMKQLQRITDVDNMSFGDLGEKKMAIFAVIPDNDTSLSYLVGMLYTQIIQELYFRADHIHYGALPMHVRFVLDEFANVSLPEEFDKSLATMRSRNMSATIIVQNLAQLKGLYKDGAWETITGNCDSLIYLGGNEQSTHEYISKNLGKETIWTKTHGQTKGKSGSYSTNQQLTGRELLTPDEVRMLDNRYALIFIRGFHPVRDEKYPLERHPAYPMTASGGYPKYDHALQRLSFEEFSGDIAVASANEQSNNKEATTDNAS